MVKAGLSPRHPLMPDIEAISTWERLVVCVDAAFKFVAIIRKKAVRGPLSAEEKESARWAVYREIQVHVTAKEQERFSAFQDDHQVWRMRGRTAEVVPGEGGADRQFQAIDGGADGQRRGPRADPQRPPPGEQ